MYVYFQFGKMKGIRNFYAYTAGKQKRVLRAPNTRERATNKSKKIIRKSIREKREKRKAKRNISRTNKGVRKQFDYITTIMLPQNRK
jgi:hypothetical protein